MDNNTFKLYIKIIVEQNAYNNFCKKFSKIFFYTPQ